jgi:2-polyprenyl-3-methyl-5-hydroxy-6-metoxy-1,4-benzoquinol methylase
MTQPVFDEYDELDKAYSDPGHLMFKKMRLVTGAVTGGRALLDFGCGQGELLRRLVDRFDRVTGVDVTDKALELSRERLAGSTKASLYKYEDHMPGMEGGFDWVTCLDVLEHVKDPGTVLNELNGLMARGGGLIVTVPNWYDIIYSRVLGLNRYHLHAHTPWGWARIIRGAGFEVTHIRAVDFPVISSELLASGLYFLGMCILIRAVKP